ncbi:uncharacterized protein LOC8278886 [Ricinus communis]|uniref:Uncharacterized protein n=1 Tax=Ricinus communis TaxID=3988 RepID=B9R7E0_RICCO|nr:uncharacterized protein LOC8278886 [Ricinus communis]EEF52420.1 conserved hypothetical protein [Ricinus communis]|eukprot:XP_002510233.1 uncharacterized protein LOC8278886 [Ricinus communis]
MVFQSPARPWFRLSSIVRPAPPAPPAPPVRTTLHISLSRPQLPKENESWEKSPPNVERASPEDSSTNAKTKERDQQNTKKEEDIATAKPVELVNTVKKEQVKMVLTEEQIKAIFKKFEAKGEKLLRKKDLKKAFYHFGFFFPQYGPIDILDANKDGFVKLKDLDALVGYAVKHGYTVK